MKNRQIALFGVLLQTISRNGIVLKVFPAWGTFGRKCMETQSKPPQERTSLLCRDGLVIPIGDFAMHGEPPVKLTSSTN